MDLGKKGMNKCGGLLFTKLLKMLIFCIIFLCQLAITNISSSRECVPSNYLKKWRDSLNVQWDNRGLNGPFQYAESMDSRKRPTHCPPQWICRNRRANGGPGSAQFGCQHRNVIVGEHHEFWPHHPDGQG